MRGALYDYVVKFMDSWIQDIIKKVD